MSTTCKYCNEPENKQDRPGLICEQCICFVHLSCLRRPGTPGDFACDVFFEYTCAECSPQKKELFIRNKFPWVNVILLTLHHLSTQSYGISNHGFFHYKTHICSFIDKHLQNLFGPQFKQKKNWVGTIAGALSVYNTLFFRSGSQVLGETGWWQLQHSFSPAVASHIIQEMTRDKPKGKPRNQIFLDKALFIGKVTEMGYKELINLDADCPGGACADRPAKKRRVDSDDVSLSSLNNIDIFDSDSRNDGTDELQVEEPVSALRRKEGSYSDAESVFRGFDFTTSFIPPSESSSIHSIMQTTICYDDSDSCSGSLYRHQAEIQSDCEERPPVEHKSTTNETKAKTKKSTRKPAVAKRESLFSTEPNSVETPWLEKLPEPRKDLVQMSVYEEMQLLKRIEAKIPKVKDPVKKAYLNGFRAKLALRRLKRHRRLPVFDLDESVKFLGGYLTDNMSENRKKPADAERVLDRFQKSYLIDNLSGTVAGTSYGTLLLSSIEPTPIRSPYSGKLLAPYPMRDEVTTPLWLRLTDELLRKTNGWAGGAYSPPPRAAITYWHVRPHHVAAVNSLCAQFFWPGIDQCGYVGSTGSGVSEALQYPEFSCVATYKKLVVGFAFLVPDAARAHREAYLSFVLTRPEWRNADIGHTMLYNVVRSYKGNISLHVSPTNPAVFLYMKLGFKIEGFDKDFYEKYYDINYKGCLDALFMKRDPSE